MKFTALVSPLALAAALALTSAANAQTTVGDQDVSEADLPLVEAHCEALAAAEAAPDTDDVPADEDDEEGAPDGELTATVDLNAITLIDCQEAGIVE